MSRIDDLERRVQELERQLGLKDAVSPYRLPDIQPASPSWPNEFERFQRGGWQPLPGCACPPGTPCGNVACPRRFEVTCTYPVAPADAFPVERYLKPDGRVG